jgi:glycosyltransferase involved in cell wall biosynthesis
LNASPTRKKIALCLEYPLALRGGVSVLVETLLLGLKNQYELVLVSPDTPESLAGSTAAKSIAKHLVWDPATVSRETSRQLARQLAGEGVHLAHFHLGGVFGWGNRFLGQCPIPWLDRAGVPVCSTVHLVVHLFEGYCGPQKPFWFKLALFPVAWVSKLNVLFHLRREIAVSQHDAQKLRRWYWPMRGKFLQIYHSRLRTAGRDEGSAAREKVVLNVGHIAWRKGQMVLAEAFAKVAPRHPEWKLSLVGKAQEQAEGVQIRALASARGLEDRIELVGERQDAVDVMRRAAIYVQPSYHEALGLALQEALFAGCACIGTNVGGIPELIEHQTTGLLVEPGNALEMAQALETLMSSAELRERYGREATASIVQKGMTEEQMIRNHVQLYESILEQKSAGKP